MRLLVYGDAFLGDSSSSSASCLGCIRNVSLFDILFEHLCTGCPKNLKIQKLPIQTFVYYLECGIWNVTFYSVFEKEVG